MASKISRSKRRPAWLWAAAMIGLAGLAACADAGRGGEKAGVAPLTGKDVPADARLVAAALLSKLVGQAADIKRVAFVTPVAAAPGLTAEFRLTGHRVYAYRALAEGASGRRVIGEIEWSAADGRRLPILYDVDYRKSGDQLVVERAQVNTAAAEMPRMRVLVAPLDALPADLGTKPIGYSELLRQINNSAVPQPPKGETTDTEKDYAMFVFIGDPLSADAKVELRIAAGATESAEYAVKATAADFGGWRVISATGRFALGGKHPLYLHVMYTPGSEVGLFYRHARRIGALRLAG